MPRRGQANGKRVKETLMVGDQQNGALLGDITFDKLAIGADMASLGVEAKGGGVIVETGIGGLPFP